MLLRLYMSVAVQSVSLFLFGSVGLSLLLLEDEEAHCDVGIEREGQEEGQDQLHIILDFDQSSRDPGDVSQH